MQNAMSAIRFHALASYHAKKLVAKYSNPLLVPDSIPRLDGSIVLAQLDCVIRQANISSYKLTKDIRTHYYETGSMSFSIIDDTFKAFQNRVEKIMIILLIST